MSPPLFKPSAVLSGDLGKSTSSKLRLTPVCLADARGLLAAGANAVDRPTVPRPKRDIRFAGSCAWLASENIPSTTSIESVLKEDLRLLGIIIDLLRLLVVEDSYWPIVAVDRK